MTDRLNELHSSSGYRSKSVFSERCSAAETLLGLVMGKNSELKACLDELEQSTTSIDKMTKQVILATSPKAEQELSTRILEVSAGAKIKISQTKDILDFLRTEQKELPNGSPPADMQMLSNIINSNSRRFKTLLQDYLRSQENYKVEVQRKTQRQLRIAYPGATEEALQQLASNPQGAREAVLRQRQTGGGQNIESVLHDIEDKYKSLKELESNVSDLHDLFLYLGALVENQQDVIDSIEASVWNTDEYVVKGAKELLIAKENQAKYETKKVCLYVLLAMLVLIVTGYLAHALGLLGGNAEHEPLKPVGPANGVEYMELPPASTTCECPGGYIGTVTAHGCECNDTQHDTQHETHHETQHDEDHPHRKHYHLKGMKHHSHIAHE